MGFNNHDSSITERQMSKNFEGIKNHKEKDLQKENNFCENSRNFDWDAFRYKDTISQSISLPQTTFHNTAYLYQQGRMGHMDSMAPLNISRAPMVEQYDNGKQSSFNYEKPSSASSDYNKYSPRNMGNNSADSEEREILQSRERSEETNPNRNSPINNH
jgi:hypothetical protein